jgi:alkylhydroperoxidase/carboxymuconolactone decarboxylase family protein YurZ
VTPAHLEMLRRLCLSDEAVVREVMEGSRTTTELLDEKAVVLTRLAGLIATGSSAASFGWAVDTAQAAGAQPDEIIDVLVTVAPMIGAAKLAAAASDVAAALGYPLGA